MRCKHCGQETYRAGSHRDLRACLVDALAMINHLRLALEDARAAIDDAYKLPVKTEAACQTP